MDESKRFDIDPDEVLSQLCDVAIPEIENGEHPMQQSIVPFIENEAIARLHQHALINLPEKPAKLSDRERWRCKWVAEAYSLEPHLSSATPVIWSSVRILTLASQLRGAMDERNSELTAALAMALICYVFEGGFSLDFQASKLAKQALEKAVAKRYENGIGKSSSEIKKIRAVAIGSARQQWKENPTKLIGEVCKEILARVKAKKDHFPQLETFPKIPTIKGWLKDAAARGQLVIPHEAQTGGRPKST